MRLLTYVFLFSFVVLSFSLSASAEAEVHDEDIIVGNVICLLPNVADGTVKPVIASGPCNGHGEHAHVVLDTRTRQGNVYAVAGSPEAIEKLEKTPARKNVEVKGKIGGNQDAWILSID